MERYVEPQLFAAAAIRPFVVSAINQRAYVGSEYDFTGFFEERNFIEMEKFVSGDINGVKFIIIERPDQCEIILKEDGTVFKPGYHQLAAKYSVNDLGLHNFCRKNCLQKHLAGMLECAVCVCEVCGLHGINSVFNFCKNFEFGDCGLFTNKKGEKTGPVIGIDCRLASDRRADMVSAILEGISYQRVRSLENTTNIEKVKIFNFNPMGSDNKDKPKLTQLAFFEMELLNDIICDDGLSKMSVVYNKVCSDGTKGKEITLTGRKSHSKLERVKLSRGMKALPKCKFSVDDYPRNDTGMSYDATLSSTVPSVDVKRAIPKKVSKSSTE